ncbi:MAG: HAD-IIIA family hydrolase [Bacteroidales bacterium]
MKELRLKFKEIVRNGGWSLFLDRDGVINRRIEEGYVLSYDQFIFLPGATEAIAILSTHFKHIFVVTNQQAVGKKLITPTGLDSIHHRMQGEIEMAGGRIDHIFVSPHLESENNIYRKPGTGMATEASTLFTGVKLSESVMAGDSASDMQFGRDAGMINVLIGDGKNRDINKRLFDLRFESLHSFAAFVLDCR